MPLAPTQKLSYQGCMHNAYCNLPQSEKAPAWDIEIHVAGSGSGTLQLGCQSSIASDAQVLSRERSSPA